GGRPRLLRCLGRERPGAGLGGARPARRLAASGRLLGPA
ncbi:MAG: hypothetical protein AVDCRST_MAG05-5060, partial [uncultured Rubrobacteraceae bacterium]